MENLDNESWGIDNISVLAYSGVVADKNLQNLLNVLLNKEEGTSITSADLLVLTDLDAKETSLVDLTGLQAGINLTHLYLDNNQISNLSPLADLGKVTEINLTNNLIKSVEAFSTWRGECKINLNGNLIRDLSPLVNNPWLSGNTEIQVQGNPLNSNALLIQIPALKSRGLTVVHDEIPVDAINIVDPKLENHLRIQLNKFDGSLTALDLEQLTQLNVENGQIKDLTGIEHCINKTPAAIPLRLKNLIITNPIIAKSNPLILN